MQKAQKCVLMEQHLSQKLSFLLMLFESKQLQQKKRIFTCWILTSKIFLWVCTILLRMSAGYKRVNSSNKMLCNGQQVNNSALWTNR